MTESLHSRRTAVYRLFDSTDRLLYVGIAVNPTSRWASHASDKAWWHEVVRTTVQWFDNRDDAEVAEAVAIDSESPAYNAMRHPYFAVKGGGSHVPEPAVAEIPDPILEAARANATKRLQVAAGLVRQHEAERLELAAAIADALLAGWRPSEVDAEVPYDRNHVRRIAKSAGVPARRESTVRPRHDAPRSST